MDAGLFFIMSGLGFILLIIGFKITGLKIISVIVFFSLAVVLLAGYQVAYIVEATNGVDPPETMTKYIIKENGSWLGSIFLIIAVFSAFLFFIEVLR